MQVWKKLQFPRLAVSAGAFAVFKLMLKEITWRFYSDEFLYGCQFDLTRPFDIPDPELPCTIRELCEQDIPLILSPGQPGSTEEQDRDIVIRLMAIKAHLPTCYVGVTAEGLPCCLCWLVRYRDNDQFLNYFGKSFDRLQPHEVLLEYIFTHRDYRGKRLMKYITLKLFEQAKSESARRAIAFIVQDNTSSLAGARAIGWEPFMLKHIRWRWFRRHVTHEPFDAMVSPSSLPEINTTAK